MRILKKVKNRIVYYRNQMRKYPTVSSMIKGEMVRQLVGKSKKGNGIYNNYFDMIIYNWVKQKYWGVMEELDKTTEWETLGHEHPRTIWMCWLQGIEKAPQLVKKCIESIGQNNPEYSIILITEENIADFLTIPDYIMEKWRKGMIGNAHFSDYLRVSLLEKYGGTWIDATVLCTKKIPSFMLDSSLFFFQIIGPGEISGSKVLSNWYLSADAHNKIIRVTKCLLESFWKEYDSIPHYFLFHLLFTLVCEYYPEEREKVLKCTSSQPHVLAKMLFLPYDEEHYHIISNLSPVHKLTYKFSEREKINGTFYDYIVNKR